MSIEKSIIVESSVKHLIQQRNKSRDEELEYGGDSTPMTHCSFHPGLSTGEDLYAEWVEELKKVLDSYEDARAVVYIKELKRFQDVPEVAYKALKRVQEDLEGVATACTDIETQVTYMYVDFLSNRLWGLPR